jgi:DNA-binding response OmpR family regulator
MQKRELFNGKRILVVDDEVVVLQTLNLIFRSRGFEVRTAASAEEALELISNWRPEIAVLDVILPGMNGLDLAVMLAQQVPTCRIVHLSGQPRSAELRDQAALEGHPFEILAKPMHPDVLLAHLAGLLELPATA